MHDSHVSMLPIVVILLILRLFNSCKQKIFSMFKPIQFFPVNLVTIVHQIK